MSLQNTARRRRIIHLPGYCRGEERMNMVTHIIGAGLGLVALLACVVVAAFNQSVVGVVTAMIYGFSVILLFTMSSIYHGLHIGLPKKVFRILDHCTIFVLIAGTYTPILLNEFRVARPVDAWVLFGVIWGMAVLGIVMKAIFINRFKVVSIVLYLLLGWAALFRLGPMIEVLGAPFFVLLLTGGGLYTLGVAFYIAGRKKKYMHSVFHLFVVAASILHSVAIAVFIL
ncbi:MAG: hemolysin III family protein [Clostridiales bacterium]|jgi:hemolysin III|nr:hemolysin III family protein [Clostridiales bacterium]